MLGLLALLVALGAVRVTSLVHVPLIENLLTRYPDLWRNEQGEDKEEMNSNSSVSESPVLEMDTRQMKLFAALARRLLSLSWGEHPDLQVLSEQEAQDEVRVLISLLQSEFRLSIIPLGAKQPLQSEEDLKSHWLTCLLHVLAGTVKDRNARTTLSSKWLRNSWVRVIPLPMEWFQGRSPAPLPVAAQKPRRVRPSRSKKTQSEAVQPDGPEQATDKDDPPAEEELAVEPEDEEPLEEWSRKQASPLKISLLENPMTQSSPFVFPC